MHPTVVYYSVSGQSLVDYTELIVRAVDYIETHLTEDIHLDDVAEAAYCSPYHFHRLFTRIVGETPANYIRKRRLTEAAKELRQSDRRILDIALAYGFESQAAFTVAFKKYHANSPAAFRKGDAPVFSRARLTRQILGTYRRVQMIEPKEVVMTTLHLVGIPYFGRDTVKFGGWASLRFFRLCG